MTDIPPAAQRFVDATNAENSEALVAAFADDAVLIDWGREFTGHVEIAGWDARENIGVHSRIRVNSVTAVGNDVVLDIAVSGEGYNGGGTFTLTIVDDRIARFVIR